MSSNDHVDAVNATIQAARVAHGDLDDSRAVRIGGGECAHVGDVVVTRRNERRLTTTTGQSIRNREPWTVVGLGDDGSITVSSNQGCGRVTVPAEYAREHVRLCYAATEHGIQGDTTSAGAELVSEATTRRGLYVGVSRATDENLMLVVTESHDVEEARDVLERVLANDRADLPAIAQRRELAAAAQPVEHPPTRPAPRCEVPGWFDGLASSVREDLREVEEVCAGFDRERHSLTERLLDAERQRAEAEKRLDPFRSALEEAHQEVETARRHVRSSNAQLTRSSALKRRGARREAATAESNLVAALERQQRVGIAARPATESIATIGAEVRKLRYSFDTLDMRERMALGYTDVDKLRDLDQAVHQWRRWADGHPIPAESVTSVVAVLDGSDVVDRGDMHELVAPMLKWSAERGLQPPIRPPEPNLSIGLDVGM